MNRPKFNWETETFSLIPCGTVLINNIKYTFVKCEYKVIENNLEYFVKETEYDRRYYYCGQLHRLAGPAVENDSIPQNSGWYYKGKEVYCSSQEEFEKFLKLKVFW